MGGVICPGGGPRNLPSEARDPGRKCGERKPGFQGTPTGKLMSIAMKPLGNPPFPLEYLQEMAERMGL